MANLPDVSSCYGAPMGRGWDFAHNGMAHTVVRMYEMTPPASDVERRHYLCALATVRASDASTGRVHVTRVRLDQGGYDSGGAYWGGGQPLYYAASDDGAVDLFFRASDRAAAKARVRAKHPSARFFR